MIDAQLKEVISACIDRISEMSDEEEKNEFQPELYKKPSK